MNKQLQIMLDMQDRMNSTVHPEWDKQKFEWFRAAWIECGELVEHYGYKWWKKQTPDIPQVELEIIDIWHFVLSMYIEKYADNEYGYGYIAKVMLDELSDTYMDHDFSVIEAAEFVAEESLRDKFCTVTAFWHLLKAANISYEDLFRKYVGKNVLNQFRQANGYKDGSYVKIWDGREDNEVLFEIIQATEVSDTYYQDVYAKLETQYERL